LSLSQRGLSTWSDVFGRLTADLVGRPSRPFEFCVIDEAQDLSVAQARFFAALTAGKGDGVFFAGDLGQRIFQQPFSWRSLGLDVRGRSFTLRINYRTSHQIRQQADRLLPATVSDVDGNTENRRGTVSMFDGPAPIVTSCRDYHHECNMVATWISQRVAEGCLPEEIGLFVRSDGQLTRARNAAIAAGLRISGLDERAEVVPGAISVGTMHFAKGLEFRAAAVLACDDDVVPDPARIAAVADEAELEEVYDTERHLLYVACTRARDHLLVTGVEPVSEFLDDLFK